MGVQWKKSTRCFHNFDNCLGEVVGEMGSLNMLGGVGAWKEGNHIGRRD